MLVRDSFPAEIPYHQIRRQNDYQNHRNDHQSNVNPSGDHKDLVAFEGLAAIHAAAGGFHLPHIAFQNDVVQIVEIIFCQLSHNIPRAPNTLSEKRKQLWPVLYGQSQTIGFVGITANIRQLSQIHFGPGGSTGSTGSTGMLLDSRGERRSHWQRRIGTARL